MKANEHQREKEIVLRNMEIPEKNFSLEKPKYFVKKDFEKDEDVEVREDSHVVNEQVLKGIEGNLVGLEKSEKERVVNNSTIGRIGSDGDDHVVEEAKKIKFFQLMSSAAKTKCFQFAGGTAIGVGVLAYGLASLRKKKKIKAFDWLLYTSVPSFIAVWVTCRRLEFDKRKKTEEIFRASNI